jgi:hypothetical protein
MLTTRSPNVFYGWAEAVLEYPLEEPVVRWLGWLCVRYNHLVAPLSEAIEQDKSLLVDLDKLKAWYHANK